ncbi:hypothetical protein J5X98_26605 [Leptothermofonsia sichuanensis E412]|nr:hypothetical protein [Leptothermofonsia sichuanensis]QZZ20745.1 hypothetical protein J5X98_26605 [Leptothermofonsia sichuanensis E412]
MELERSQPVEPGYAPVLLAVGLSKLEGLKMDYSRSTTPVQLSFLSMTIL